MASTRVLGSSFSPAGEKVLVSSDETGIFNAVAVPVDGSQPVRLTDSQGDAVRVAGYFPADERFLYLSDQGGNELHHLYVRELDGSVTDLTPGERLTVRFLDWSVDGETFLVSTNERDPRFFDIYEYGVEHYRRSLVFRNEEGLEYGAISPDERYVALRKDRTRDDSDIYLYDRQAGTLRHLTPHDGNVVNDPQAFSPDGSQLYVLTDAGSEFAYLARIDLGSGETEPIMQPPWDVSYAEFSRGGAYLVVGVNEDARTQVHVFDYPSMRKVGLPDMGELDVTSVEVSPDEGRLAFYASTARTPSNLYVSSLERGRVGEPKRLTDTLSPDIDAAHLVVPERVRFTSYDGVEIPGILYRPHGASPDRPVPALVWVHGGPGGQSRLGYSSLIQFLVNRGYAVFAINNRGSTGYGKSFFRLDDRRHGEADLDDCVASKSMLSATGWVDADRIGIIGGSYGGYMVLAALAFRPEEFAAGVDLFGISNWVRTLESIPPWWESFREALYREMGDPATDSEELYAKSPLFHAERIRRPLMVLQGANDPRVLQAESDDIVEAARANGVPVEYVLFEDEGHGFAKKENQLEGWRRILAFLDRYLAAREPTPPETVR
ncbi:MAG: S9 family peptidase [Gemmatimonadota bacterium]|nr:MAG: S9 family peptidase [Gemmatimonadota bacterium]